MSVAHELPDDHDDPIADIELSGRLDVSSSVLHEVATVCASGADLVLVDVAAVTAVTPSGMAELMHAMRWTRSRRADLRIHGASSAVADALDALELGKVLVLYTDRDAAVTRDQTRTESLRRAKRFSRRRDRGNTAPTVVDIPALTIPVPTTPPPTTPPPMEVVPDNVADLRVVGRLDVASSVHDDVERVCADGARLVLVDVAGVSAVTPSGVADLMHAIRWARSRRSDLRIFGSSPAVADALYALQLDKVLVLYADREAAVRRDRGAEVPGVGSRRRGRRAGRSGKRSDSVGSS